MQIRLGSKGNRVVQGFDANRKLEFALQFFVSILPSRTTIMSKDHTAAPAASQTLKSLENTVTCAICLEILAKPKALPCLHSFCERCLEDHYSTTQKKGKDSVECPTCRETTKIAEGVRSLKDDFKVNSLIELYFQLKMEENQRTEQRYPFCILLTRR